MPFFKNQPTFKVALCIFNQTPFTTQLSPKLTSALLSAVCPHRESSAGAPKARQAVPDLAPCLPSSRLGTVSGRHTSHQLWPAVCHLQARTRYITQYIYILYWVDDVATRQHINAPLFCVWFSGETYELHTATPTTPSVVVHVCEDEQGNSSAPDDSDHDDKPPSARPKIIQTRRPDYTPGIEQWVTTSLGDTVWRL